MRGLGKGIREFNSAKNSVDSELKEGMRETDPKPLNNTVNTVETNSQHR